jgi:cell division control protein 6
VEVTPRKVKQTTESIDSIFQHALHSKPLFKHHQALHSDYVPDHLPFRTQQITSIAQVLSPILHQSRPSNLLIYGKTGTGKTVVTKHVTTKLSATCQGQQIKSAFIYCNTRLCGTEYRTLADLANGIGLKIPFTGLALSEVLSRIQAHINDQSLHVIFIMDEIDSLVKTFGDNILYNLTTSSERVQSGSISLIGISNDLQFKEDLGARVLSRLSEEELVFPPYSADELKSILIERAEIALSPNCYATAAINLCAALSGSEHGDARRAVDLLRVASEIAEREGNEQLQEKHVRIALQKIDQDRIVEALRTLPLHAKLVLLSSIHSSESPRYSSGVVYDKYIEFCAKASLEPLTQRRVSGLLTELDTLGLVSARVVNYGRYGRTKQINAQVSLDTAKKVFSQDETIKHLLD